MANKSDIVVTKSNALIEASYVLTLNEQRIVLACAARLDGRKPLPANNQFTITAEEYADLYSIDMKNAYGELKDATERLYDRTIEKIEGKTREHIRWVYQAKYFDGEGRVTLGFSPTIAPYLTLLNKRFTSYRHSQVAGLNSVYAIRLFEMLAQFQDTGVLRISEADFRDRLVLHDKYDRFANLKARVIDPAVNEIEKKSSLNVTWKPIRKGRKVEYLEFRFEERQQMEMPLAGPAIPPQQQRAAG